MKVESEIKKWGNSLALRVTGIMADLPNFRDGTKVIVEVSEEGIMVKPVRSPRRKPHLPYSEKELLADLSPESAHADELANPLAKEMGD
jgi:antitoxin MazE